MKIMLVLAGCTFAAALAGQAACCNGQTDTVPLAPPLVSTGSPYVPTMTFDVASVKENKDVDIDRGMAVSVRFMPHSTVFRAINGDLKYLLVLAYGVQSFQISGDPNWPFPAVFMIEARSDSAADAKIAALTEDQQKAERQHMLQELLEDRFKLKTHGETKEGDVYNLVVIKSGSRMAAAGSMAITVDETTIYGDRQKFPLEQYRDGQGHDLVGRNCSMDKLASMLTAQFGRPVSDKTGLTGSYDFVLKYKGRFDQDRPADDLDPTPPLDRALQDELGLKVESARGPVKLLVIDHVEKPSAN
jgi:uncharacterized protein (TIGR03435 family)